MKNNKFNKRQGLGILGLFLVLGGITSWAWAVPKAPARAAAPQHRQPAQVLVKFRDGAGVAQQKLAAAGLASTSQIASLGVQVVPISTGQSAEDLVAALQRRYGQDLDFVETDRVRYAHKTPNDPLYLSPDLYYLRTIGCPSAWDSHTGSGITIAIADTGVDTAHPDLAAHLVAGRNVIDGTADVTDHDGHGTAVAGMAAAVGDNAIGVVGAAYDASILPIKISDDGTSTDALIADAIVYAADRGAKVVNISFGSDLPAPFGCWTQTVILAAQYMRSAGGSVIVSAGNAGLDKGCSNVPEIINVAATNSSDELASFSNFGAELDVAAPGEAVGTTSCKTCTLGDGINDYLVYDGTSFSSPLTAGALALIYAVDPSFTPAQAEQILTDSATDLGVGGFDSRFGWGRVNVQNAIGVAQQRSELFRLQSLSNVYAYPNPWDTRRYTNRQVTIANVPDTATVNVFTVSGFWVKTLSPANGRAVWDLNTQKGEAAASGLYFYLVQEGSRIARGEIAIIK